MFEGLPDALGHLLTVEGLILALLGSTVGVIAAVIPGISGVTVMALILVIVAGMDKYDAFTLLVTIMAAGGFAGSLSSILFNVPGDSTNAPTCLDGFPLARKGRAGVAIGASAAASALGALIGVVVLIGSLPIQRNLVLAFGPPEIFALSLLGISFIAGVSSGSLVKGLVSGGIGMLLGFIGVNLVVGGTRYTFGVLELYEGIPLIPALVGIFAIPELILLLRSGDSISEGGELVGGGVREGIREVLRRPALLFRSSMIGTFIGMVPGVGATVASWLAYYTARNTSHEPESFGRGNIEGVIAPEASIDAKEGSSLIPVFVLGIPSGVSTAILLAAFQFHGILPGASMYRNEMTLVWVMILGLVFANVLTSVFGLAFSSVLVRLTVIPVAFIAPFIFVFTMLGAWADSLSFFGVLVALAFGLAGLALERYGYPRPPLLLGLILLPLAEVNFHQALQLHRGSYEFLLRPMTLAIFGAIILGLALPRLLARRRGRRRGPAPAPETATTTPSRRDLLREGLLVAAILVVGVVFLVLSFDFPARARVFPLLVLVPFIVLILVRLVAIGRALLATRAASATEPAEAVRYSTAQLLAWLIALPVLMWAIGFQIAFLVYLVAFMAAFEPRVRHRFGFAGLVVASLVVTVGVEVALRSLLGVRLPTGLL